MRKGIFGGVLSTGIALAGAAHAEEPAAFGRAGQLSISSDLGLVGHAIGSGAAGALLLIPSSGLSFESTSSSPPSGSGATDNEFAIDPAADYFVIDNLSVGAELLFAYVTTSSSSSTSSGETSTQSTTQNFTAFGASPRVGYDIPLGDIASIWPKVYLSYVNGSYSNNGGSANGLTLGAFAPVLFHLARHFYVGVGPDFSTDLSVNVCPGGGGGCSSGTKYTQYGAMATVGGWFGL